MKSIIGLVLGGLVLLIGVIVGFSAVNIIAAGERGMVSCLNILVARFRF